MKVDDPNAKGNNIIKDKNAWLNILSVFWISIISEANQSDIW
jgi:hypothetical protein